MVAEADGRRPAISVLHMAAALRLALRGPRVVGALLAGMGARLVVALWPRAAAFASAVLRRAGGRCLAIDTRVARPVTVLCRPVR